MVRFSIAIDGTAASGKSTVAKLLAEQLNCSYLDTGKLYRALALDFLRDDSLTPDRWESDSDWLRRRLESLSLHLEAPPAGECRIVLGGEDVNDRLADLRVEKATPYCARIPAVRDYLLGVQRDLAKDNSVVMAGRDIGTVVLPHATLKVFIEADLRERARRRLSQHTPDFTQHQLQEAQLELESRDEKDREREVAPMVAASDALRLDSTSVSPGELVERITSSLREKVG